MRTKQPAFVRPTGEALRLTANQAVSQTLKSNFGVKSTFYRVHDCQHTLERALERRNFDFDTAYGLLYLMGHRPQLLETADGFALLLLPSASYNRTITLDVAIQEAKVYLARALKLEDETKSVVKMLGVFGNGMTILRDPNLPREKFLLEFKRNEIAA